MHDKHFLFHLLLAALLCLPAFPQERVSEVVLILDASGSMWGKLQNEPKITGARRVLKELVGGLSADTRIGLISYGHRRKGDCNDIEILIPAGGTDHQAISTQLQKLNPVGMTPLTKAIETGIEAGKSRPGKSTVVLVTDGLETCGGDPCATVRKAKQAGVDFRLHVIGFDVGKENVSQLECAAQAGEGLYLAAGDAAALGEALQKTVASKEAAGDSRLSVKTVLNGELHDSTVTVLDQKGKVVAGGRTYAHDSTNPRVFPLPAGTYNVVVTALHLRGDSGKEIKDIAITRDKPHQEVVDFSSGEIAVKVTRNGELSDAAVAVFEAGDRKPVAGGRTYRASTSNPRVMKLSPGSYDVEVKYLESQSRTVGTAKNLRVEAGKTLNQEFAIETGTLAIKVTNGGELADAVSSVLDLSGKEITGARTYSSPTSNPREYQLEPGKYKIRVRPVRFQGKEVIREVEVKARQRTEEHVAY